MSCFRLFWTVYIVSAIRVEPGSVFKISMISCNEPNFSSDLSHFNWHAILTRCPFSTILKISQVFPLISELWGVLSWVEDSGRPVESSGQLGRVNHSLIRNPRFVSEARLDVSISISSVHLPPPITVPISGIGNRPSPMAGASYSKANGVIHSVLEWSKQLKA